MASADSEENQKLSVELATGNIGNLESSVRKLTEKLEHHGNGTLDNWTKELDTAPLENIKGKYLPEHYEMPLRLNWNLFRKIYDIQPTNYEQLISIPGFGPSAVGLISYWGNYFWN